MTVIYSHQIRLSKEYTSNQTYDRDMHGGITPAGSSKFNMVMCLDKIPLDGVGVLPLGRGEMFWSESQGRWCFTKSDPYIIYHIRWLIHGMPYPPSYITVDKSTLDSRERPTIWVQL